LSWGPGQFVSIRLGSRECQYRYNADADWAASVDDRRSSIGYVVFLGLPIIWRRKKQSVCARSSAEAEYRGVWDHRNALGEELADMDLLICLLSSIVIIKLLSIWNPVIHAR
jgi:hypothetical protein